MQVGQPPKSRVLPRLVVLIGCILAASWTCHGVLSGHRVKDHTFEEALRLVRQGHTDPSRACAALRHHIIEAIQAMRQAGEHGAIAIEAIHKESRP